METWKPINGFPLYEVSDEGRVRRLKGWQCKEDRLRNPVFNPKNGYLHVLLCQDSQKTMKYIHRLVAEAFIGLPPKMTVNHKDGNKTNNLLANIEVVTQAENNRHMREVLGKYGGKRNLTEDQVINAIELLKSGMRVGDVSNILNIPRICVTHIRMNKKWKHVGNPQEREELAKRPRASNVGVLLRDEQGRVIGSSRH